MHNVSFTLVSFDLYQYHYTYSSCTGSWSPWWKKKHYTDQMKIEIQLCSSLNKKIKMIFTAYVRCILLWGRSVPITAPVFSIDCHSELHHVDAEITERYVNVHESDRHNTWHHLLSDYTQTWRQNTLKAELSGVLLFNVFSGFNCSR